MTPGGCMRFLLTSAGIKNASIRDALVDLLGKPIADSSALCIPTAGYGHPQGSPDGAWRFISGQSSTPMCELGWNSLGVLELTALPSIDEERWAAGIPNPAYAIDDQTAIKVTDGTVEVVSEGHWKLFTPSPSASESG